MVIPLLDVIEASPKRMTFAPLFCGKIN